MTQRQSLLINNETLRYALVGVLFGLMFPLGASLLRIANSDLPFELTSFAVVQRSDSLLWIIDTAPLFLGIFAAIAGRRQDVLQKVYEQLKQRENDLEMIQAELELRVKERTGELVLANQQTSDRAEQLQLIADVAQSSISIQDVDRLLPHIAELISKRFRIYHVGIFLVDEQKQNAILRASNSVGGLAMIKRGHHLKIGEEGIVGFVTLRGEPRLAFDVGQDAASFNNPDLPDTRSELALPLKIGSSIIGALDLQSAQENAFTAGDVAVLTILADQAAIAIQNARLSEHAKRALVEAEIATKQLSGEAWREFLDDIQSKGYRYDGVKPEPLNESAKSTTEIHDLEMPVQLRGQTIGRLKMKTLETARTWTDDERAIIESTAERVAIAIESARLLDEAQKRATREAFLSDLGTKLGTSFQIDSILRDTVEELGQTLKGSTISFQLVNPSAPPREPKDENTNK